MKVIDNSWRSWRALDFYKDINEFGTVNPDEWNCCPSCKEKPRLWIFDNGEFAKCKCQGAYEESAAYGHSIMDYYKKHGNTAGWNHNDLRDNWNAYVEKLKTA